MAFPLRKSFNLPPRPNHAPYTGLSYALSRKKNRVVPNPRRNWSSGLPLETVVLAPQRGELVELSPCQPASPAEIRWLATCRAPECCNKSILCNSSLTDRVLGVSCAEIFLCTLLCVGECCQGGWRAFFFCSTSSLQAESNFQRVGKLEPLVTSLLNRGTFH